MIKQTNIGAYGLVKDNDRILLTRHENGPYKGLLDLPGGNFLHGETARQCVTREMEKESDNDEPVFVIRYYYDLSDASEITTLSMYKIIADIMNEWMHWAKILPEYNPMISLAMLARYVSNKTKDFNVDTFITILEKIQGGGMNESQRNVNSWSTYRIN